ncbi:MAG: hypothetical protein AUK47_26290 [Deltaproteobacteria bacterium CG2_30_63_29]|nr:MAG: hypothetical protein AUK47_26290 [Deltaproteobacteria bacterium CG2_30_63_29]PJB49185.1 MAG: hypothetical protein CO108_00695 [Deltaproteobacteria bacterium CG_4_9_14_3_um_filter_63_12]
MPPSLDYLWWPLAVCVVIASIHNYLGLHVLERKVIFVDLALAQIAALGATFAFLVGFEPKTMGSYLCALIFTVVGAGVFAITRMKNERIPQEAVIGISYAMASAATIVMVDAAQDPHGAEHIQELLAGSVVWVNAVTVAWIAAIYLVLGLFHLAFRKRFIALSTDPDVLRRQGVNVPLWDFVFYLVFGLVITVSVQIAGILMVFTFLIVPGAIASLFADSWGKRLVSAWLLSLFVSFVGLLLSFDRPSGPVIVVIFGIALIVAGLVFAVRNASNKGVLMRNIALGAGVLVGIGFGLSGLAKRSGGHEHHEVEGAPQTAGEMERYQAVLEGPADSEDTVALEAALVDPSDLIREGAIDTLLKLNTPKAQKLLAARAALEPLESLRLRIGVGLAGQKHIAGLDILLEVLERGEYPMSRDEALTALKASSGDDFGYDAFAENKENTASLRRWREWRANVPW